MKLSYIVCLLVLCGSHADKEIPEDFASLLSDADFQAIQKRLSELSDYYSDDDRKLENTIDPDEMVSDPGSGCYYKVEESKIIRTHDSINNGAEYIDSPSEIQNKSQCRKECCKHAECDLAVFKDKGDEHACYLFACGGACLFTNHTGFSTMQKYRKPQQHEMDLENLATDQTTTTTATTTTAPTTTTTQSTTTSTTTTTPTPTHRREPVPLDGACSQDNDCAGANTVCVSGTCVCPKGSHAQEGICREDCSRFQFECANVGKPSAYPQCIAVYDTCDGISHCRDGSDEMKCDSKQDEDLDKLAQLIEEVLGDKYIKGTDTKPSNQGSPNQGTTHPHRQQPRPDVNSATGDRMDTAVPPGDVQHPDHTHLRPPGAVAPNHKTQEPNVPASAGGPSSSSDHVQQYPQRTIDNTASTEVAQPVKVESTTHLPQTTASTSTEPRTAGTPDKVPAGNKKPAISGGVVAAGHVANDLVNKAEVARSGMTSNRTAVVVLALGLAVTAMLLIFVGCRLRMVKRRLRRGRPLNSNEADYLINGMYL